MKFKDLPVGTKFLYGTDEYIEKASYNYLVKISEDKYMFNKEISLYAFNWGNYWNLDVYPILEWEDELCLTTP